MHHGLYRPTDPPAKSNQQAQVDMIDAVLEWAGVSSVSRMADVGCGIGGSSCHVARAFPGAGADGITLSPVQAARANALAKDAGLADRVAFSVGDALAPPLPPSTYDLVWSLESGEHMPDKRAFVRALATLAAPGGRVIIVTWVHRDLSPTEPSLHFPDRALLATINRAYYLPPWCSAADYVALMEEAGLRNVRRADWSDDVAPFWGRVVASALTPRGIAGLIKAGWKTMLGALAMPLMAAGFKRGSIRFALLVADKQP